MNPAIFTRSSTGAFAPWKCTAGALVLSLCTLGGCAAMQRTWLFKASDMHSPAIGLKAVSAHVTQKTVYLDFDLVNRSEQPVLIEVDTMTLTLPDGTEFVGKTSVLSRTMKKIGGFMQAVGLGDDDEDPRLPPGGIMHTKVAFRQYGRDFRRHPKLTINLSGIQIDEKPTDLQPLTLLAPEGAPMGEDI